MLLFLVFSALLQNFSLAFRLNINRPTSRIHTAFATTFPSTPVVQAPKVRGFDHEEGGGTLRVLRVSNFTSTSLSSKPPALYIPGLDGLGAYSRDSLYNVSLAYDLYSIEMKAVSLYIVYCQPLYVDVI